MSHNSSNTHEEHKTDQEYDFGVGHPSNALNLNKELVAKCMRKHLDPDNAKYFMDSTTYGLCDGSWYFRSKLADWLNALIDLNKYEEDQRYESITGSNMILTTGASQSMELLLIHLKKMKHKKNKKCANIVLCEDPSYFLFPNIAETADCKLLPIGFIDNRLDFELLESMLIKYGKDIIGFYMIPNHQNPLGISYIIEDKIKLIQLCHKYELHLIADEVYNLLSFDENKIMIQYMASIEHTLFVNDCAQYYCHSISSLSKIIGPGFRVGWIYSYGENVLESIANHGSLLSGGCMTHFVPSLLQYLLEKDEDEKDEKDVEMSQHLMKVRRELATNCRVLCETIKKYDTQNMIQFNEPKGGYFMWLQLPEDKIEIIADKDAKVKYFGGKKLSSTFGPIAKDIQWMANNSNQQQKLEYFNTCVRFCFAYLNQQQIREGAKDFVQSIYNLRSNL